MLICLSSLIVINQLSVLRNILEVIFSMFAWAREGFCTSLSVTQCLVKIFIAVASGIIN